MEAQKKVKQTPENYIKELRRKTRRVFSTEQKISIVMEGMRAETSVREICRKYGIVESLFYKWNKEFFEAGKQRLWVTKYARLPRMKCWNFAKKMPG